MGRQDVAQRAVLHTTGTLLALERVEVAHAKSYQQPTPSFASSSHASSFSFAARKTASSASPHYRPHQRTGAGGEGSSSDADPSMDYVFTADDAAGPPATRVNGAVVPRSLAESVAVAEAFYFRDGDDDNRGLGAVERSANAGNRAGRQADDGDGDGGADSLSYRLPSSSPRKSFFCALCREEVDLAVMTPRQHVLTDSRASHTNHTCREVVLDSLALLGMRGYPLDHMYEVWSTTLFYHESFPRIRAWVQPWWPMEKRVACLSDILLGLKDAGIVDVCLAGIAPDTPGGEGYHHRRRVAFERLEYIGDNAWSTRVSSRMMVLFPDQQWTYSERAYGFNCFRDALEMNVTNEILFDALHLEKLFPPTLRAKVGTGKIKADVVEALIGELHCALWSYEPRIHDDVGYVETNGLQEERLVGVLEHCLTELYDLVMLNYCQELSWNAVPLARELAARHIWLRVQPSLKQRKGFPRRHSTRVAAPSAPQMPVGVVAAPTFPSPLASEAVRPRDSSALEEEEGGEEEEEVAEEEVRAAPTATTAAAAGSTMLATVRILPSTPGLFAERTPYPRTVPHPLRAQTIDDIPSCTRSSYTGLDVFTGLIESYKKLNLLSDDAFQVFDIQSAETHPPLWQSLVGKLVPSLAASEAAAGPPLELEKPYFSDPYYRLFKRPLPEAREDTSPPRLWGSLQLPKVTRAAPFKGADEWLGFLQQSTYPSLQSAPVHVDDDDTADAAARKDETSFAPSRFVPPVGVKPPSAGVVTDRNLYPGQYAFLAFPDALTSGRAEDPLKHYAKEKRKQQQQQQPQQSVGLEKEEEEGGGGGGFEKPECAPSPLPSTSGEAASPPDADSSIALLTEAMGYWVERAESRRRSPAAAAFFSVLGGARATPHG